MSKKRKGGLTFEIINEEKQLLSLVGKKITGICRDRSLRQFGLEFDDGSVAWIQRDEEGNGPGYLNIEK
jgi:hypothetical protein